jgi:hypothetical protein
MAEGHSSSSALAPDELRQKNEQSLKILHCTVRIAYSYVMEMSESFELL